VLRGRLPTTQGQNQSRSHGLREESSDSEDEEFIDQMKYLCIEGGAGKRTSQSTSYASAIVRTSGRATINKLLTYTLLKFGLNYICPLLTKGDGNCFFRAIVSQIRNRLEMQNSMDPNVLIHCRHHMALRKAVCKFAKSDRIVNSILAQEKISLYCIQDVVGDYEAIWKEKIDVMSTNKVWAEDIFTRLTAWFLKKDVRLAVQSAKPSNQICAWVTIPGTLDHFQAEGPPITLGYITEKHFESIYVVTPRPLDAAMMIADSSSSDEEGNECLYVDPYILGASQNTIATIDNGAVVMEASVQIIDASSSEDEEIDPEIQEVFVQIAEAANVAAILEEADMVADSSRDGEGVDKQMLPEPILSAKKTPACSQDSVSEIAASIDETMIVDFSSSGDEVADCPALLSKLGENCVGCGTMFGKNPLYHLRSKICSKLYNMIVIKSHQKRLKNRLKAQKNKDAYRENPKIQQQRKKKEYQINPEIQQQRKKKEYQINPEIQKQKMKKEYKINPEIQQQRKKKEYKINPEIQQQRKKKEYKINPEIQQQRKKKEYKINPEIQKQKMKTQYKKNPEPKKKSVRAAYKCNKDAITAKKRFLYKFKCSTFSEQDRLRAFLEAIGQGLRYICISCHKLSFWSGVYKVPLDLAELWRKNKDLYKKCFPTELPRTSDKDYLCHTCRKYIVQENKMPPLNHNNGLSLDEVPACLKLTEIGNACIARNIIFLKLFKLPVSQMSCIKDKVVNVPVTDNDILQTLSSLLAFPRTPGQAGLIPVQLKRKLEYKSKVLEQYIDPEQILAALKYLVNIGHPGYEGISINPGFLDLWREEEMQIQEGIGSDSEDEEDEVTLERRHDSSSSVDDTDREDELDELDEANDPVQRNQVYHSMDTVMQQNCPEIELVTNRTKDIKHSTSHGTIKSFAVAPGEGKVPTSLMREPDFDTFAFPFLHPTGKYGIDWPRVIQVTAKSYFLQRLLNKDKRFSSYPPYVFAILYYLERKQFESQINISCRKGKIQNQRLVGIEDGFEVFDKIQGTPRYWRTKRYELVAKLEQLGPFQLFFTLSCADKRWPENFVSILRLRGLDVKYEVLSDKIQKTTKTVITVDGTPMEEYLTDHNLHEMVREEVLTITRSFDHRVHCFINHIVMGKNSPMKVQFYNYRVEFQLRGAGHIHGVLWLDMQAHEKEFANLRFIMTKLRLGECLTETEVLVVTAFVDKFISCSLTNKDVCDIVREVQIHRHTHSCQKYGKGCRFGYPRFPSDFTIIAQPLKAFLTLTADEEKALLKQHAKVLSKVKSVLKSLDEERQNSTSIKEVLDEAGVSTDQYYSALKVSKRGTSIILQRTVAEIYVNNYNTEWIKAWNGNMDIQVCLDFFAVITYITDYYSKDDTGLMDILREAAKTIGDVSKKERMRFLANTFLTHRQVGMFEAFYRIIPFLHLSQSNVKCTFVPTGFRENRSRFLKKVEGGEKMGNQNPQEKSDSSVPFVENQDEDCDDPTACDLDELGGQLIEIDGHNGKFRAVPSIHDKYANRPKAISLMCLAQFAIMYETHSYKILKKKVDKKEITFINGTHGQSPDFLIILDMAGIYISLPIYIKLDNNYGYMKLRSTAAVLRIHKFKEQNDPHQFIYSELLLYHPWRAENDLHPGNEDECRKLYEQTNCLELMNPVAQRRVNVVITKQKLFPFKNNVEEAQQAIADLQEHRPQHIGDTLDAEAEQDNADDQAEGMLEDVSFAVRDPGDLTEGRNKHDYPAMPQRVDISQVDAMLASARQLAPEQRRIFDQVIDHCKSICQAANSNLKMPEQLLLKVNGGAGSGKSKLIHDISQWAEKILRTGTNKLRSEGMVILKLAPTGKAASLINGMTLHSAFNLHFTNIYTPMPDQHRETKKIMYSQLKLIIIDEMSMVKSDQLYQIHLRLKELRQDSRIFGGVSILLFGDLMQLRPVCGMWIFQKPGSEIFQLSDKCLRLWKQFMSFELVENHRQGDDKQFADILNKIRIGVQEETDLAVLMSRVCSDVPANAIHVYGTKAKVAALNTIKLEALNGVEETIRAKCIHPYRENYKPPVNATGQIGESPFQDVLKLKIDSLVMLTYNVDTADGLTNGTAGKVVAFVKNSLGEIQKVIVDFIEDVGDGHRQENRQLKEKYPGQNVVAIGKIKFDLKLGKGESATKVKIIQVPLTLSWAITAHKCQGQTVKSPACLVADIDSVFGHGMAYVILGRVQSLDQLYLESFKASKITVDTKALKETAKMSIMSKLNSLAKYVPGITVASLNVGSLDKHFKHLNTTASILEAKLDLENRLNILTKDVTNKKAIHITSLNIVSLPKHFEDLKSMGLIIESDILCLNEISLNPDVNKKSLQFPGYKLLFAGWTGHKDGVGIYLKKTLKEERPPTHITNAAFQMLCLHFTDFEVLAAYRSPSYNTRSEKEAFVEALKEQLDGQKTTFILGDMNEEPTDDSIIYSALSNVGFQQVVKQPTHMGGRILDHIYIPQQTQSIVSEAIVYPCHFSDHDIVSISVHFPEMI
jgi:ATP-dependent DNA helicase PIF1